VPSVVAVAAIGSVIGPQLLKVAVDRRRHLIFDNLLQGLPAKWAETFAPFQAVGLHCLHDLKCHR
jgi:hypothetical protein